MDLSLIMNYMWGLKISDFFNGHFFAISSVAIIEEMTSRPFSFLLNLRDTLSTKEMFCFSVLLTYFTSNKFYNFSFNISGKN